MFSFLADPALERTADFQDENHKFDAYLRYLRSIQGMLPVSAFAFATAPWHYNVSDHRCPCGARLESLTLSYAHHQANPLKSTLMCNVRLLGSRHDGHVDLQYRDVTSYELALQQQSSHSLAQGAHVTWLVDEVRLSATNHVLHEVVFAESGRWLIECADVRCWWRPLSRIARHS